MNTETDERWKFIGGSIPLDFVNSGAVRVREDDKNPLDYRILKDKLESYQELVTWAQKSGIIDEKAARKLHHYASKNKQTAEDIFLKAIVLREAVYRILISLLNGLQPEEEDVEELRSVCVSAREHQKLIFDSDKFRWDLDLENPAPGSINWQIALSASELLTSDKLHRIKQCPGENCGWLFLDSSKNGSRQWCDMKDCGNLAKVRKFREKQK